MPPRLIVIIPAFLLLFTPPAAAQAQEGRKDSLLAVAAAESADTARIPMLLGFAKDHLYQDANHAIEFALRALYQAQEAGASRLEEDAFMTAGSAFFYAGVYDEAVRHFVKALRMAEARGDRKNVLKMRINLISVKLINSEYDSLIEADLSSTLALAREQLETSGDSAVQQEYMPLIYNHLAYLLHLKGDNSKPEGYLKQSLALTEGNPRLVMRTVQTMAMYAEILLDAGKADEAIGMTDRYLALIKGLNQTAMEATAYLRLGEAWQLKGDFPQAIKHMRLSYRLMEEVNNLPMMAEAAEQLSKLYQELGRPDSALYYTKQHVTHEKQLKLDKANEELARFEVMEQFRKIEAELKAEQRSKDRVHLITTGMLLLLLSTGFYLYFSLRRRYRKVRLEKINVELNAERRRLENEFLEAQLESSNKQMVAEVISRMKKNELLREVVGNLISLKRNEKKEIRSLVEGALRRLEKSMEDQAMEDFEIRFKNLHLDFFKNLNQLHPGLTPNERRLCAFLKLDMNAREIAAITGQSPDSIYSARWRLRQKLGLHHDTEQALVDFIEGLG